jgi:hypothetical protein
LLTLGLAMLVFADLVLGVVDGLPGFALGLAPWGLHMGMTQGLLLTLVADTAHRRQKHMARISRYSQS